MCCEIVVVREEKNIQCAVRQNFRLRMFGSAHASLTTTTTFSTPLASTTLGLVFRVWRLVFCVCFNDSRSLHDWSGTHMKLTLRPEWRLRPLSSFLGCFDLKTGVSVAILFAVRLAMGSNDDVD